MFCEKTAKLALYLQSIWQKNIEELKYGALNNPVN